MNSRPSTRRFYIYVLKDPFNGKIRYIGATHMLKRRLQGHILESNRTDTWKSRWIRGLIASGLTPAMEVIETVSPEHDWRERERWWIAFARSSDWNITNATDGGEGVPGYVFTDEVRARMSEKLRGRKVSIATREKIGAANKRCTRTEDLKGRLSEKARKRWSCPGYREYMIRARAGQKRSPLSPQTREKISQSQKGKVLSPEHRAKLSASHKGKKHSESAKRKVSEALRNRQRTAETNFRIAEKARARWASPEFRAKIGPLISAGMKSKLQDSPDGIGQVAIEARK